jgi:hypothetical protein
MDRVPASRIGAQFEIAGSRRTILVSVSNSRSFSDRIRFMHWVSRCKQAATCATLESDCHVSFVGLYELDRLV